MCSKIKLKALMFSVKRPVCIGVSFAGIQLGEVRASSSKLLEAETNGVFVWISAHAKKVMRSHDLPTDLSQPDSSISRTPTLMLASLRPYGFRNKSWGISLWHRPVSIWATGGPLGRIADSISWFSSKSLNLRTFRTASWMKNIEAEKIVEAVEFLK